MSVLNIIGLLPFIIALLIFINHDRMVNYYSKIQEKSGRPINRRITSIRLTVFTIFFFIIAVYLILKV